VTLKIVIRPAAEDDLDEASTWYERRQAGLGKRFLAAIDTALAKIQSWPEFGIVVHKQLRRASVRRFPYGIFYQLDAEKVVVVGVLHNRRAAASGDRD
jgi:plasmid stabilization system protein ParE